MDKTLFRGKLNKSSKTNSSQDLYIEGIMSTPVVDLENEIIGRESYPDAISEIQLRKANKKPIPIFVEHRRKEWSLPVGTLEDAKETEGGLWFKAKIIGGPDGSYLDTVQRLIKAGALYGCSIGGDALKSQMMYDAGRQNHVKKITQMDLRELSLTGMPVNQGSSFSIAKSLSGKDKIVKSEWQKEVSSLYKSLDGIIDKEMSGSKIKKSISSLDSITKALEETVQQGDNVNDVDILDKIKGALTDLADLLGIQDLVNPSAGEEMGGFGETGEEEMAMDAGEEPMEEMMEEPMEEMIPEESNELPEEVMDNGEEMMESEEAPEEEFAEEPIEEEFAEEPIEEELDEEPVEEELEEEFAEDGEELEEEFAEDGEELEEDEEELQEDRNEFAEDINEGAGDEELAEGEEEIMEGEEELEEDAEEMDENIEEGVELEEEIGEELGEGSEEIGDMGDELMSDNVEDIENKLDKIIQLLSKKGKGMDKKKSKKEKEKSIGGDTMGKDKTQKAKKAEKAIKDGQAIEKSSDIVGVRGEQATTPEGADVIASQHPHSGDSTGNGKENFDIAVADNPSGAQVEVGQKEHGRSDANTAGNDDIAIAESPEGVTANMSKHPYSVYKCANPKCATEFSKSEDYDPNFCVICGTGLDKYVYATDEQIQVLKDLEILQDMPSENTGYAVSDFTEQDGSYIKDKMKAVQDKRGNDIPEQSNNRNIQYGGQDVDGYGHDGHDYNKDGSFKDFLEGANNAFSQKYKDGSEAYNGPKGVPASKPYVGYTVKSQEENKIEKAETPVENNELDDNTKANIEKSIMGGLLEHTNSLIGKIDNLEKTVQEMKDQPIKKSVQTSGEIRKSKEIVEKAANQVWANAFGFKKGN